MISKGEGTVARAMLAVVRIPRESAAIITNANVSIFFFIAAPFLELL
jgi:hypothetical protein